jgi:hypothetical protein
MRNTHGSANPNDGWGANWHLPCKVEVIPQSMIRQGCGGANERNGHERKEVHKGER